MQHKNWNCPKCHNTSFETDQFRATGGIFSKIFDVQNKTLRHGDLRSLHFYRDLPQQVLRAGACAGFLYAVVLPRFEHQEKRTGGSDMTIAVLGAGISG